MIEEDVRELRRVTPASNPSLTSVQSSFDSPVFLAMLFPRSTSPLSGFPSFRAISEMDIL